MEPKSERFAKIGALFVAVNDMARTDRTPARDSARASAPPSAPNAVDEQQIHRAKMQKHKAAKDRLYATKTREKGLLMVYTGPGKGKTTAAMGMGLRMLGHGRSIAIIQFIKGAWESGERYALERQFPTQCSIRALGEGFTWETQDKARDQECAEAAWQEACNLMQDSTLALLILDEINIALRQNYLDIEHVVRTLEARRADLHVVATGRNAPSALLEIADMVSEIKPTKHHFRANVKAQKGIEF